MMEFISVEEAHLTLLKRFTDPTGVLWRVSDSRAGSTREVIGHTFRILDGNGFAYTRRASPQYAAAELLWYLSWGDDGEQIMRYAPSYARYVSQDATGRLFANGAYGKRWGPQMPHLLNSLRVPNTRQAVLATWRADDLNRATPDCPCTLSLQFLPRNGELHCVTTMRSNDIWLGAPYDLFCFTALQTLIANDLAMDVGHYIHNVGSMHLYVRNLESAESAIDNKDMDDNPLAWVALPPGALLAACAEASLLERRLRAEVPSYGDMRDAILRAGLHRTILGGCLMLCWYAIARTFIPDPNVPEPLHALAKERVQ